MFYNYVKFKATHVCNILFFIILNLYIRILIVITIIESILNIYVNFAINSHKYYFNLNFFYQYLIYYDICITNSTEQFNAI